MMMRLAVLSVLCFCMIGCGPSTAYRKAQTEPVALPEGITLQDAKPLYPVPENGPKAQWDADNDDFEAPRPPRLKSPEAQDEQAPEAPAPAESARVVLARDGSGYPIIMMHTRFAWAWEYVGQALVAAEFEIDDRDRDSGIFYIEVPEAYRDGEKDAQIKLSQTANGIQIAVLKPDGSALLDKGPGQDILSRLYDEL